MNAKQLMSESKFYEAYSRFDESKNRYETWEEAIHRVMNMHRDYYGDKINTELNELMIEVEDAYKDKLFLGAQRGLQFGGEQLLKAHARLYNCASTYCDRAEVFGETMYMLLCGAGVGFSVQKQHISNLPQIGKRTKQAKTFIVPDSIEGWSEAIDVLLSSFFIGGGKYPQYEGRKIYFDLTEIRPKGSFISGGFKAPGAEPLRQTLDKIEYLLTNELNEGRTIIKPIVAYDIMMYLADAVISGGVRRSATICMFSKDDEEMIKAKTGSWFVDNPQRGRSNNSVMLLRNETTFEEFKEIMESVKHSGEPGFIFVDDLDFTLNPCVTGDTLVSVKEKDEDEVKQITIKEIVDRYEDGDEMPLAMSFNKKTKEIEFGEISNAWLSKENAEVFEIETEDGQILKCTPDHKIWTENRGYVEAQHLTEDDMLVIQ